MTASAEACRRAPGFRRNARLEDLLCTLNDVLACSEKRALAHYSRGHDDYPIVFVMGPHRSGTTLFMQWLASTGAFSYPSNMLSRFFGAPVVGAQIQLLLTDPRYNYRNEILDFDGVHGCDSENGKTKGALAPNEFWYFWRRFLPFKELDWLPDEELLRVVDRRRLVEELTGLTRAFGKPFALKGMILNYNIPFLRALFARSLFVQIKRDPVTNVASMLEARKRQGDERAWYSFRIREYPQLKDLAPIMQSAGQLHYISRAVAQGMATLEAARTMVVEYEDFCRDPRGVFEQLVEKVEMRRRAPDYCGPKEYRLTRNANVPNRAAIERALAAFECDAPPGEGCHGQREDATTCPESR